jgi:hypothetical protein
VWRAAEKLVWQLKGFIKYGLFSCRGSVDLILVWYMIHDIGTV